MLIHKISVDNNKLLRLDKEIKLRNDEYVMIECDREINLNNISFNNRVLSKLQILPIIEDGKIKLKNMSKNLKRVHKNQVIGVIKPDINDIPTEKLIGKIEINKTNNRKYLIDRENKVLDINPKLSNAENDLAVEKLENYITMFANKPEKIELANITPQDITLTDNKPVRIKNYQLGFTERKALIDLMKNLEKAGVVTRKPTRYASPVFLKKKPDDTYRLLVDYRVVNLSLIHISEPTRPY